MLEKNRLKAVEEIKTILEEHKQLYSILNALLTFKKNNQYDEYINLLIQAQPILNKYRKEGDERSILLLESTYIDEIGDYIMRPKADKWIIESVFEKYADNNTPIYFYPARFVDKPTGRKMIGYKSLENEEDTLIEFDPFVHPMRIELDPENKEYNIYGKYRSWYFRLLFQHNVDETYSILKKLEEADKTYYRVRKK